MDMDTPHIVKHVAEFEGIRLILKFVFAGFSHGISRIMLLSATTGRQARSRETTHSLLVSNMILSLYYIFYGSIEFIFQLDASPSTSHKLKHGDLTEECQSPPDKGDLGG